MITWNPYTKRAVKLNKNNAKPENVDDEQLLDQLVQDLFLSHLRRELDVNKKNFDTLALQRELSNRGYSLFKSSKRNGTFDGILGDETKNALLDWQSKNKTKVQGNTYVASKLLPKATQKMLPSVTQKLLLPGTKTLFLKPQ